MTAATVVATYTSVQGDGGNVGSAVTTDSSPTANDYLVVCLCGSANADAMTKPDATWTEITVSDNSIATGGGSIRAWYKKNPAALTTYAWASSSGRRSIIGALVRGAHGTNFVNIAVSRESPPGANHTPGSMTTTTDDALILDFPGHRQFSPDVANWIVPAGGLTWTELQDIQGADGNNNIRLALGSAVQATAGAVPTNPWTNSDTLEDSIIIRVAITPAVTGGGTSTISPGTAGDQGAYGNSILVGGLAALVGGTAGWAERAGSGLLVPGTASLAPGTISSQERFGSPTVQAGTATAAPGTAGPSETVIGGKLQAGTATITPGTAGPSEAAGGGSLQVGASFLSPGTAGIGGNAGGAVLQPGAATATPGTAGASESIGSATLQPGTSIVVSGTIGGGERAGSAVLAGAAPNLAPGVAPTDERFGSTVLVPGTALLSPGTAGHSEHFTGGSVASPTAQTLTPGTAGWTERFKGGILSTGVEPRTPVTHTVRLDRQKFYVDLSRQYAKVRLDRKAVDINLEE